MEGKLHTLKPLAEVLKSRDISIKVPGCQLFLIKFKFQRKKSINNIKVLIQVS